MAPLMEYVHALKIHSSRQDKFLPPHSIQRFPSPRANPTSWFNPPHYFNQPATLLKSFPSPFGNHFEPLRRSERNCPSLHHMKTSYGLSQKFRLG